MTKAKAAEKPGYKITRKEVFILLALVALAIGAIFGIPYISEQNSACKQNITGVSGFTSSGRIVITGDEALAAFLQDHVNLESMPWQRHLVFRGQNYVVSGAWRTTDNAVVTAIPCISAEAVASNMSLRNRFAGDQKMKITELPPLTGP